jgi:hypothetical protein
MANELRNLTFTGRGTDPREVLVEDRTKPHSDHCDSDGLETTAAVGILKAVHVGTPYVENLGRDFYLIFFCFEGHRLIEW